MRILKSFFLNKKKKIRNQNQIKTCEDMSTWALLFSRPSWPKPIFHNFMKHCKTQPDWQ